MFARVLFCLALAGVCGCAGPPADNVLIISFDTTRADRLSAYGYPLPTTPRIDDLAAGGVLFENAFSHVPSTLPSHCSLLTGLLPPSHGVRANGKFRLADERLTLAEILRERGYETGAIIGALPLDERFGMDQGFDDYDGHFAVSAPEGTEGSLNAERWFGHRYDRFERRADEVTDLAIDWLEQRDDPWFLMVHYFDPHAPYDPPPEWRAKFDQPYDGEVAFADAELGRLLDAVDRLPGRTLVVFTADHGEGLGDHGEAEHNRFVYDSTLRVPLVMAMRGRIPAGVRVGTNVGLYDVAPTILDLLDIEVPQVFEGRSLAAAVVDSREPAARPIYGESLASLYESGEKRVLRCMIDGKHKLILTDVMRGEQPLLGVELYDLAEDRGELRDLTRGAPGLSDRLKGGLVDWSEQLEESAPEPEPYELDPDMLEALRNLGYLR